jgi:pimeloyl-ACP methyl ester carboxylesterase
MRALRAFGIAVTLAIFGASFAVATVRAQDASPVGSDGYDALVDVGGRNLHVACVGAGPTVLFEQGGPASIGGTAAVAEVGPLVSQALGVRFCAYDRAGSGQSDPHPMGVHTFEEAAGDMNAVLAIPELACPCVVIGESMGGSIALIALDGDPGGFSGLVLLDAPYPGYWDDFTGLAPADSAEVSPEFTSYVGGENEESIDMAAGFGQVVAPAEPPAIPVVVVTHGAGDPPPCFPEAPCSPTFPVAEFEAAWQDGQAALAEALGAELVVAEGTGHSIASENPELVLELTAQVLAAVEAPSAATPAASPSA